MYRKTIDLTEKNVGEMNLIISAQSFTGSKFNSFSIVDGIRILVAQMIIEQIGEPI